jgi:hypothetical protein
MKAIETTGAGTPDHRLTVDVQVPAEVSPGNHSVVLVLEDAPLPVRSPNVFDFPVIDVAPGMKGCPWGGRICMATTAADPTFIDSTLLMPANFATAAVSFL